MGGATGRTTTENRRATNSPRAQSGSPPSGPAPPGRRLSRRRVMLVALLVAAVASFATWALYGSSWLRVEKVSVSGVDKLGVAEVRDVAAIALGTPMASVDKDAARRRVSQEFPRVETIEVVRGWPHGIGLKVTERTPVAVMRRAGGRAGYVEVDAKGVRFGVVESRPAGVPLLVIAPEEAIDSRRFGVDRLRREAAAVAGEMPRFATKDLVTVRVRSFDSITLELTGNRVVMWGSGEYGAAKVKALRALMKAHSKGDKTRYFDVSVPSAPAVAGS